MHATPEKKNKGFTLIELLVVIAILAILSGVLLTVINPAALIAKGRDARRMEDLDLLKQAILLALADGEITLIEATGDSSVESQKVDGTGWVKYTTPAGAKGLSKFIPALPVDPTNSGEYVYTFGSDGIYFELNAVLESPDNVTRMTVDGGDANEPGNMKYEVGTNYSIL